MIRWPGGIKAAMLLATFSFFLFEFFFQYRSERFREYETIFLSFKWLLMACAAIWCVCFLLLTFNSNDLPLAGLLFIAIAAFYMNYMASSKSADAIVLFAGVMLCKTMRFCLQNEKDRFDIGNFLICIVALLAVSAWWHLDLEKKFYHRLRWTGLWEGPNIYGMLMGVGGLLAAGLLAARKAEGGKRKAEKIILVIAIFMLGAGLVMSCSRGAWLATATGFLYLARCHGKFRWRYILPVMILMVLGLSLLWGRTPDSAPWYVKRADLDRPSAQHRASAWWAGLEIMRDHPFGVGWNKAVSLYEKNYSPPEGGAFAVTTNDYLMIGTELGIPALLCFVTYLALCYRQSPRLHLAPSSSSPSKVEAEPAPPLVASRSSLTYEHDALRAACLSGALVFIVAFWFDGGLFKLPTAALFWTLLELGKAAPNRGQKPLSHKYLNSA